MTTKSETEKSESFNAIRQRVDSHGGVLTLKMRELREAHGAKSLGPHVVAEIQVLLENQGIGHSPQELPTNGGNNVRLHTLRSRFEASLERYSNRISSKDDEAIRKSFTCDSLYEETIMKVRDLLS